MLGLSGFEAFVQESEAMEMSARTSSKTGRTSPAVDPMPAHIEPMLAVLATMPEHEEDWYFEYKWDGVRAMCFWDGVTLRTESRNGNDITGTYPELQGLAGSLSGRRVILDGEIVALGRGGSPDFGLLQRRMGLRRSIPSRQAEVPISFMIFDLLYLDGRQLLGEPYRERRRLLERLGLEGPAWKTPPSHRGEGTAMLRAARENHLEGLMAKRPGSIYQLGRRSGDWLKIKIVQGQEFVVGGWVPLKGDARRGVGALLLGYYEPDASGLRRLAYAGKVGTGFKDEDRMALKRRLQSLQRSTPPFAPARDLPDAYWVKPQLVAEIEYRGWTPIDRLRQPSFKGLRTDKDPGEVERETPF